MAEQMDSRTRWEEADGRLHREKELPAVKAKQGRSGLRILGVLLVALVLAFIVWIPVEIWGRHQAAQEASQPAQSDTATAPAQ